jgi:hypothetical protein
VSVGMVEKERKEKYRIGKDRKEKCRKEIIVIRGRLIEIVKQF